MFLFQLKYEVKENIKKKHIKYIGNTNKKTWNLI